MHIEVGNQYATAMAEKTTEPQKTLEPKTLDNLSTAMHGEAFAYLKYLLYSNTLGRTAIKNSRSCSRRRPSPKIDIIYLEFEQMAKIAGDAVATDRFEEICHDEMGHRDAFKIALTKLES
jgi:rubrerythrin